MPRLTVDIDIVLLMEEDNLNRFIAAMEGSGYKPTLPVSAQVLKNAPLLQQWKVERNLLAFSFQHHDGEYPLTIDVLLTDKINIVDAIKRAVIREVDGIEVRLASIEDLIILKSNTGRRQDLADIEHLKRLI